MTAYIVRRILYMIPQVLGICLLTFLLFEVVYTPDARAKAYLGKGATPKGIADAIYSRGWGKPILFNHVSVEVRDEDVFHWPGLVRALVDAGRTEGDSRPPAALVWDRLSPELQDVLGAAASAASAEGGAQSVAADVRRRLLDALNDIVDGEDFHREPAFDDLRARLMEGYGKERKAARDEEKDGEDGGVRIALNLEEPTPRQRRWLNRRALNAALGQHVAQRYDLPVTGLAMLTETRFAQHMTKLLLFRFGRSDKTGDLIGRRILEGAVPSLTLTVPIFILGLIAGLSISLVVARFLGTYLDLWVTVLCVAMMSVSILVYIIAGQYLLAMHLRMFPVYGYAGGIGALRFLMLPIIIAVIRGLGGTVRFYRTIFAEEVARDHVRTARAKGLGEGIVLFKHVLKNAMIPILTRTVLAIPFLILGSLLLENFFGIPGLGNMTLEAINNADFSIVIAMVYLGALLFAAGNLLTDISYTFVDPRVRLR